MCITEVWSYRECGCWHNHSVQCPSSRKRQLARAANPAAFSNGHGQDTILAVNSTHTSRIIFDESVESRDCPFHQTVQKSFLNQICDDCLLAEIEADTPAASHNAIAENLIWDSQVEIVVDEPACESPVNPTARLSPHYESSTEIDNGKHILESHVEVTIENGSLDSFLEPSVSTSTSMTSLDDDESNTSWAAVSPPPSTMPHLYQARRHGCTFEGDVPETTSSQSELQLDVPPFSLKSPPPSCRGRTLQRLRFESPNKGVQDIDSAPPRIKGRLSGKPIYRLRNLRSMSTTFLSSSRLSEQTTSHGSRVLSAGSAPRGRNMFYTMLDRKSRPSPGQDSTRSSASQRPSLPTRKSSLLDLGLSMLHSIKSSRPNTPGTHQGPGMNAKASVVNPSLPQQTPSSETFGTHTIMAKSRLIAQPELNSELEIPEIPRSSTMHTLRAVINDLNFGMDKP